MVPTGFSPLEEFVIYVGGLVALIVGAGCLGYHLGRRSMARGRCWYAELAELKAASADLLLLRLTRRTGKDEFAAETGESAAMLLKLMARGRKVFQTFEVPTERESLFEDGVCAIFGTAEEFDTYPARARAGIRYVEQQIELRCQTRRAKGGR